MRKWIFIPYLLVIFGCIFFRIEYWPLSDFRIFSFYHTKDDIFNYRLGYSKGSEFVAWLYDSSDMYKNRRFYNEVIFIAETRPELVRELVVKHRNIAKQKALDQGLNADRLTLFRQKVILDQDRALKEVVNQPLMGVDF